MPFAMTPTEESIGMFEECMPKTSIHTEANCGMLRDVIDHQRKQARLKQPQEHILMVMDDMM